MRYTNLPNTDLRPSNICLGTAEYGSSITEEDSFQMLDAYIEAGGNFLDTAHIYADWQCEIKGMSELTLGRWLAQGNRRERMIVATKGGHPPLGSSKPRLHRDEVETDLKESLRRLQVDYIDLYWLHRDDETIPVDYILDTLESARKDGLIRWYGASNWSTSRLQEIAEHAKRRGIPEMVASQIQWSLAKVNPESVCDPTIVEMDEKIYRYHQQTGLPVVAFTSQACGFFSGNYSCDQPKLGRPEVRVMYASNKNWTRLERACSIAKELGCTTNQIALAYLIAQPFSTFPIVGCRRMDQLLDSLEAEDIELTGEQVRSLAGG